MSLNLKPLSTPPFLICLFLLLFNDFYLKAVFHNSFTGKLSDICGLFIFPIFWSALFPGKKLVIYSLTTLFFIYWKSSYSDSFIDLFSQHLFTIQRTVDLTDLLALVVLPLSWHVQSIPQKRLCFSPHLAGLIAFFSFCATSMPRPSQHFAQPQYLLFQSAAPLTDSALLDQGLRIYNFDSLVVVEVVQIALDSEPVKDDDFNKNLVLEDLEKKVLKILPSQCKVLPGSEMNKLTIKATKYQDQMTFKGSRLHGKFIRRDQHRILIVGQYKNGIEDSVWTFVNPSGNTILKKTFKKGETTRVQQFTSSKLSHSTKVFTRSETRMFKGLQLAILLALSVAIAFRLRKNHKMAVVANATNMKVLYKALLVISLPFFTWLLQLIIWLIIPDHYSAAFDQIVNLFLIYVISIPYFMMVLFWFKPKKQTDILLYCLLFSLLFVFWRETIVLNLLLKN